MITKKKSYLRVRNPTDRFFFDFFPIFFFLEKFSEFWIYDDDDGIYSRHLDQFPRVLEKNCHEQKVFPSPPEPDCEVFFRLFSNFFFICKNFHSYESTTTTTGFIRAIWTNFPES